MEKEIVIIPEAVEQQISITAEPFLLTKTQDKTVALDMSEGDQVIRPDGDSLLQSVTVEKPDTLIPENIVENVNIGGVTGARHIPEAQSKTAELDFSESDTQVITPDDDKLLDSVTINKPETLIPENIKKDIEIGGVTGEYEIVLPPLVNPATEDKVIDGYEYLDGDGAKRIGTYEPTVLPPLINPATDIDVAFPKEYIDGQGVKQTGTYYTALEICSDGFSPQWNNISSGFTSNKITFDSPKMKGVRFYNCDFLSNTEITVNATSMTGFSNSFRINRNLKKITLLNLGKPTSFYQCFQRDFQLEEIDADLDFTDVVRSQTQQAFEYCEALQTVRFVPNTIGALSNNTFTNCMSLSDASLVYIANGLKDGVTGETLTLHATPKTRTLAIMGTVSQVTEDGVTYNFFTADEQGTTSLNAFITQVKGWSLA